MGRGKRSRKNKKGKGGGGGDDLKTEQRLQAILLADSFTETFRPITREQPKVLLPLVNVPMLEYSLEFLASNNVEEVFVFCCSKADMVKEYLVKSKWNVVPDEDESDDECEGKAGSSVGPDIYILTAQSVTSAGDALREIDSMGVIQSNPFVLVSGDVISNMDLNSVVETHRARRKKDSTTLMTMVFKKAAINHRTRALDDDLVIAVNDDTNQLLRYSDDIDVDSVTITQDFIAEHGRVRFRYDVLDCHIYVCSPEVLVHFSDNYDYANIRNDYIHNEVQNAALAWRFFGHFIENEYAARVHDPRTYDAVCRDIVSRWTYPLVPDTNIVASTRYRRARDGTYKEPGVRFARSARVSGNSVVGANTAVGACATVHQSTIGRNCFIGDGCVVEGCYIWDNVTIEAGATVKHSILCNGVVVRKNASIGRGSVVSYNVVVGEGFAVDEFTRLTCVDVSTGDSFSQVSDDGFSVSSGEDGGSHDSSPDVDSAGGAGAGAGAPDAPLEETGSKVWNAAHVGEGGVGRVYPADGESDEEGDDDGTWDTPADESNPTTSSTNTARVASHAVTAVASALRKNPDRAEPVLRHVMKQVSTLMGATEVAAARSLLWDKVEFDDEEDELKLDGAGEDFSNTVRDMLLGGAEEGHDTDAIALEISCFRHAENRTFSDVAAVLVPAMLDMVPKQDTAPPVSALQGIVMKWGPLIRKFVHSAIDASTVVEAVYDYVTLPQNAPVLPLFGVLLLTLNNTEATSAAAIQSWANDVEEGDDAQAKRVLELPWTQRLLQHLAESDSEDEDDSSGSEDSGSESDDE